MRTSAILLALVAFTGLAHAGFVVVKNAKNPTAKLNAEAARGVFSGKTRTWSNGENIVLVIGKEDVPAMSFIAQTFFHTNAKTYLAKLKQDVFKGDVTHPVSADDNAKTLDRVKTGAGVIGVIDDSAAKALPAGVVLLAVDP